MFAVQAVEANLESESAKRRRVKAVELVGGADENSVEVLHLRQQFIDLRDLPTLVRTAAVGQQAIRFIEDEHRVLVMRLLEHSGDVLFAFADVLAE